MTEPQPVPAGSPDRIPVGRALVTALLLRRFGLLPLLALTLARRGGSPAADRVLVPLAATAYLGALVMLLGLVLLVVGGLALLALTA